MSRAIRVSLLLLLALALPPLARADKAVPPLSGRVVDEAGILPADARQKIEGELAAIESKTGAQVAVLTVNSLDGDILEDYSLRVAQTWGLGHKGKDDGVLFLVAKDDHKMRIEVGYGLEATLPDVICARILDNVVRPKFRAGDFGGGVEAGVAAIASALEGNAASIPSQPPAGSSNANMPWTARLMFGGLFLVCVGTFSLIALFSKGGMSWFLYLFLMPFHGLFPMAFLPPGGAKYWFLGWVVLFPIAKFFLRHTKGGIRWVNAHPGLASFAASSGGSSWSSGGGGGFSGGGGSFGGGGASSSW